MKKNILRDFMEASIKKYKDNLAFHQSDGVKITYQELHKKIVGLAKQLKSYGLKKDDKVAILSKNCANWGISYLAINYIGAVVVPILNDFSKKEIENILLHSEAKAIFVSDNLVYKTKGINLGSISTIIGIEDFSPEHIKEIEPLEFETPEIDEEDLAAIIYTSGTTSASKGVMLTNKNLVSNTIACHKMEPIYQNHRFISMLPMPHTYECTLGFLLPLSRGSSVYYMLGQPTLSNLKKALNYTKPTHMLSVPLIIEKIHKQSVEPAVSKGILKLLYNFPPTRNLICRIIGKKLIKFFGGELVFFGIGGALLDANVEKFLRRAKFPYGIGYGLTETSPLLAGTTPRNSKYRAAGPTAVGMEARLVNIDPKTQIGEIEARGDSLMKGYYKQEDLTKKVITEDGWFKTGDMGYMDKNNYIFIKGRLKNVIVGATGENIYPEDIETVINSHSLVSESLVYELEGKLIARIHLNSEIVEQMYSQLKDSAEEKKKEINENISNALNDIQKFVNENVSKISKLSEVIEQQTPFIKTPTHKIKKFLYTNHKNEVKEEKTEEKK